MCHPTEKETLVIRLVRVLLVLGMVLGLSGQAFAAQGAAMEKGAGGVAWGADPAQTPGFMKLKSLDGIDYFVNLRERMEVKGFSKPTVFYGALNGHLFVVHLRLKESAFDALKTQLTGVYGRGKQGGEEGGRVIRWKAGPLKVKLKEDAETGTKLSFYSQPVLASQAKAGREPEPSQELVNLLAKDAGPVTPNKPAEPVEAINVINLLKKGRN